jgi:benzoylformate decarboxylase
LSAYDLVVVLGAPIFLYYAYVPGETVTPATKLFQITNSPHDAAAALAGRSIVGDVAEAANYLLRNSKPRSRGARTARNLPAEVHAAHPITPAYLFNVLNKLLPRDAIICEECPSSKGDLDAHILLDEPGSFYSVRSGILGFGLPAAVGLQLAHPERRVVCPVGDGSVQYSIQALWTAVQENAPVIFIVLHNGDYSALKSFCDFTRVGRDVPGMDLPAIDIVKIAGGYGMASSRVERCEELAPVLREAFSSKRPCLISVRVTPGGDKCMGMDHSVNPPDYR